MTIPAEVPLTSPEAWADGVWLRQRSGPTTRSILREVTVSTWHRVRDAETRIRTACGYGPRDGYLWPSGGARLEIARPMSWGTLPGDVCRACRDWPAIRDATWREDERVMPDEADIDDLADAVARRLIARADERSGSTETP